MENWEDKLENWFGDIRDFCEHAVKNWDTFSNEEKDTILKYRNKLISVLIQDNPPPREIDLTELAIGDFSILDSTTK